METDIEIKKALASPVRHAENYAMAPPSTSSVPKPGTSINNPQALMMPIAPAILGKENLEPTIQNIVATINLGTELKLTYINTRTRNSEYNPGRFTGLVMRIRNPRATALIFKTGKIVCTGTKTEEDSLMASKKFARIIQKLGFSVRATDFKIHNVVATADCKFPIKLENFCQSHGQFCTYEPELYPGLIYRMILPRVVLLIFVNGKIVLTGAKTRQDLKDALNNIHPILKSFRKQ